MKYMNNHFGQSRIFENARCKIPMNLQFFGYEENGGHPGSYAGGSNDSEMDDNEDKKTPTVEELMVQIAELKAELLKTQNKNDTLSSENAKQKKQLRAKMSANEQEEEAKKEAEEAKDRRIKELEAKIHLTDYSKRFMGIGMDEETATELASLTGEIEESELFFLALDKFVKAAVKKAGEDSIEALIKSNPSIKAGNGDGIGESLAVRKARELAQNSRTINQDILKNFM